MILDIFLKKIKDGDIVSYVSNSTKETWYKGIIVSNKTKIMFIYHSLPVYKNKIMLLWFTKGVVDGDYTIHTI